MSVKLTYFDLRGRAEVSRLVLHAAKKKFDDNRLQFSEWSKVKPTTPFGSLPVLEVAGDQYAQGMAMATYLARENGLYGANNLDGLRIDMIHQLREDLLAEEVKVWQQKDQDKKEEMTKNMNENAYPRFLTYFNKMISDSKSDFVVGDKLSLADIVIYEGTQTLSQNNPALLDKYPDVKALRARLEATDGLKQYLKDRKKSDL